MFYLNNKMDKKIHFFERFEINRDSWESFFCFSFDPKNKYFLGKKSARAWATNSLFVLPGFSITGGDKRTRTADICLARAALYQLSYTP